MPNDQMLVFIYEAALKLTGLSGLGDCFSELSFSFGKEWDTEDCDYAD